MNTLPARRPATRAQTIATLAFLLLFPGFFFYHTLLGIGAMGAVLGGYFALISLLVVLPLCLLYAAQLRRARMRLTSIDVAFAVYLVYFFAIMAANGVAGANPVILANHLLGILYSINTFILFQAIDFSHPGFRRPALLCMGLMSAIVFTYSVDGAFYLGALGIARDAESLATYQGFSRSYLFTFIAVIAFTPSAWLRLLLYCVAAPTLFVNTARSEFVAMLFLVPIIELYFSRNKLLALLTCVGIFLLIKTNMDDILTFLPDNRILELLDLSQSSSANKRHYLNVHAMQTIGAHPLFGDYASYEPGYYAHNVLSAWVDLGLFGFVYLMGMLTLPLIPMFIRDFFSPGAKGVFLLGFSFACATLLLLLTSHYFTDMLVGATLGAYSKYLRERYHAKHCPPDFGPPPLRQQDLRQAMP